MDPKREESIRRFHAQHEGHECEGCEILRAWDEDRGSPLPVVVTVHAEGEETARYHTGKKERVLLIRWDGKLLGWLTLVELLVAIQALWNEPDMRLVALPVRPPPPTNAVNVGP